VVSAALIVFVVRSSKPFFSSRPGKLSGRRNADYRRRHLGITLYADCTR